MSWSRRFDEPIILPNDKKLLTLEKPALLSVKAGLHLPLSCAPGLR
jgi:hypothetical protein